MPWLPLLHLQPRPRAPQRWRLRSTQSLGSLNRGGQGGASSEREGRRRKDKKGSGAGAYGGRRGTRRAGGCRMVGCAKREGRGNRGAWAAPAGVLGAALGVSRSFSLRSSEALTYLGGWASRPRKEEQLEMALGRRRGEGAHLWGEREVTRGRRDRPEPGGARGSRSKGSQPLPQGSRPRNGGSGACWRREAAGVASHRDPLSTCSPERRRPAGRAVCARE